MRTTQQLRDAWAPACKIQSTKFTFWTGVAVTVDERTVPALHALDDILRRHGYAPKAGQTWGFACRPITGGTGYSLHAYGIAVDINSVTNPYGRRLVTDMARAMVDEILAIRTLHGLQVWRWGGDYSGNKDAMHFEVVVSPAELAAGITASTAAAPPAVPSATEAAVHATTPSPPLLLEADMKFKDENDEIAWQVNFAYTTLLGRPVESLQELATRMDQVRADGYARVWDDLAKSDESVAHLAKH